MKAARDVAGDLDLITDAGQSLKGKFKEDSSRAVLPVEAVTEMRDDRHPQGHGWGETRFLVSELADVGDIAQLAHGHGRIKGVQRSRRHDEGREDGGAPLHESQILARNCRSGESGN